MAKTLEPTVIPEALTFDDVLLVPRYSEILPSEAITKTYVTRSISLNVPILSAAMDTVSESRLCIAMAQSGGMGVLHRNLEPDEQAAHVRQVKRYESGLVVNPFTIHPDAPLSDALNLMQLNKISGVPVVENNGKLVGILTNRDVRFATEIGKPVSEFMTKQNLITVKKGVSQEEAKKLLHTHRIEKLLVVDDQYHITGLITVKDIENSQVHPLAAKDTYGRLLIAAASTVGEAGFERAKMLIEAGVDVLVIDTAHGHSSRVIDMVKRVRALSYAPQIIAGNIATAEAADALIASGVDGLKVGIGPGSICTTRIVAGVGVPQLSAIMDVVNIARQFNVPVIADGGIKFSGDLAKAIAAGASAVMVGSLLAGTEEAPGDIFLSGGRTFKAYRGMGSVGAMARGSADRYFQADVKDTLKLVPEGIEGQVPYKGPVSGVIHQLVGGLRASMGYCGARTLSEFQKNARFVRITNAGLTESHVHGVQITRESPNYSK